MVAMQACPEPGAKQQNPSAGGCDEPEEEAAQAKPSVRCALSSQAALSFPNQTPAVIACERDWHSVWEIEPPQKPGAPMASEGQQQYPPPSREDLPPLLEEAPPQSVCASALPIGLPQVEATAQQRAGGTMEEGGQCSRTLERQAATEGCWQLPIIASWRLHSSMPPEDAPPPAHGPLQRYNCRCRLYGGTRWQCDGGDAMGGLHQYQ